MISAAGLTDEERSVDKEDLIAGLSSKYSRRLFPFWTSFGDGVMASFTGVSSRGFPENR
jgi:hypothetical protein